MLFALLFAVIANAPAKQAPSQIPSLHFQHGNIALGSHLADLRVPAGFAYLSPREAEIFLTQVWNNPRGPQTLGVLVRDDVALDSPDMWAVVIEYDDGGHVADDDADRIDFSNLLKDMQSRQAQINAERRKQGFQAVRLVGWASAPRYEAREHKLYWAKELDFDGAKHHSLNYNIRVLGREGTLILNAVSSMAQLAAVQTQMQQVMDNVAFTDAERYEAFDPSSGHMAAYGIAALVAGNVAAKAGLFKGLLMVLVAMKKFVFIALAAAANWLRRLRGKPASRAIAVAPAQPVEKPAGQSQPPQA